MVLIALAISAGILQVAGYIAYVLKFAKPNALSWLMWAYGTSLLAVLEYDHEIKWYLLLLPIACALCSIAFSIVFWRHRNAADIHWSDWVALGMDLCLTAGYLLMWYLEGEHTLTQEGKETAVSAFLLVSNLTTISSFWPTIRGVWEDSSREHWLPWFIWTLAYGLLAVATVMEYETLWSMYMLYPAMGFVLHGTVSLLARRTHERR